MTGKAVGADVQSFVDAIEDPQRRTDAETFGRIMERVTGAAPRLWPGNIVGFGSYHYKYESGREGDSCLTGYSPRKGEFTLYLDGTYFPEVESERSALLERLGKHRVGKSCIYVKRASDIDLEVLEKLVTLGVSALRTRYGSA